MKNGRIFFRLAAWSVPVTLLLPASCSGPGTVPETSAASTAKTAQEVRSGAELWSQTCARCHSNRSPSWYTDAQWDVAVFHMGVKANLTRAEREAVLHYLQEAN